MGIHFCTASGKMAYVRPQDAEKAIAKQRFRAERGLAQVPLSTYRCAVCRRWHLTSMTPQETAERKQARGGPPPAPNPDRMNHLKKHRGHA